MRLREAGPRIRSKILAPIPVLTRKAMFYLGLCFWTLILAWHHIIGPSQSPVILFGIPSTIRFVVSAHALESE